jgi:hypothetical protein
MVIDPAVFFPKHQGTKLQKANDEPPGGTLANAIAPGICKAYYLKPNASLSDRYNAYGEASFDAALFLPAVFNGIRSLLNLKIASILETTAGRIASNAGEGVASEIRISSWGNPKSLARHFLDHGKDFGAKNAFEYQHKASEFLLKSQRQKFPTKIDYDGTIRVYDPKTNTFGSYRPNGATKTFYKPDPKLSGLSNYQDYWNAQKGSTPWTY